MPRRPWFRFSLKTLLVIAVVVAIAFGWLGRFLVGIRRQRDIVDLVKSTGGSTYFDYQIAGKHIAERSPPGPFQLRYLFGDDAFAYVTVVFVEDAPNTAKVIERLRELPRLTDVSLSGHGVNDAGMDSIAHIGGLKALRLGGTSVTAAGLSKLEESTELASLTLIGSSVRDNTLSGLAEIPNLRSLQLIGTNVSSQGIGTLAKLRSLRQLDIYDNPSIDDAALERVSQLAKLESLAVGREGITDAGVRHLHKLKGLRKLRVNVAAVSDIEFVCELAQLEFLELSYTKVEDDDLRYLAGLSELRELDLKGTPISDGGIVHLAALTNLKRLELSGTQVTDSGVMRLASLTNLERLSIGPNCSEDALRRLARKIPSCAIHCAFRSGPPLVISGRKSN